MDGPLKLYQSFSFNIKAAACFGVSWLMIITSFTQGQDILKYAGTIVSDGESVSSNFYKLMFLRTSNSSNNTYLVIQYDDGSGVGEKPIVWVANRENPLPDHSGVLTLTTNGTLMITSKSDPPIVIYSQNPSLFENYPAYRIASSLDFISGNIILKNFQDVVLWKSIDYPTDTWLPDMKLGIFDLKSGQSRQQSLVSWLNPSVAASGACTLGVDPNNTKQLVISQRGSIVWESGVWNGTAFSHLPPYLFYMDLDENNIAPAISFNYVSNEDERYFTFGLTPESNYMYTNVAFLTVNSSGALDLFALSSAYNKSVSYGYSCPNNNISDWSTGCAVKPSICPNGDKFVVSTKFTGRFDESNANDNISMYDCKEMCRKNCTCVAYSSQNKDGTGCLFSYDPSLGNLLFTNGSIYLRQKNDSQPYEKKDKPYEKKGAGIQLLVIVCVPSVCFVLIIVFLQVYIFQRSEVDENGGGYVGNALRAVTDKFWNLRHPESVMEEQDSDLPFFSFYDMRYATNNFSIENKLGQGGFGPVYKGKLENGTEIAVKRLSKNSGQGIKEFKNEVILISKLQHRNLVKLLGCCIYRREKLLVYEYMPNNSLDSFIFDPTKRVLLDWGKRFNIIQGIAQGLLYLHKYSRLRIIHRDLKTSNVLLDNDLNPKISDFGTARIFGDDESSANTLRIVGTYGYMAPEYAMDGLFSEKSDVFSYGVMMLEIISGKKNTGFYHCDRFVNLLGYAWELWKKGKGLEFMDAELNETSSTNEVMRCIQIGLLCVQESAEDRPTMLSVMSLLSHESITVPIPKQPAFLVNANASVGQPREDSVMCSVNNVTLSDLNGR